MTEPPDLSPAVQRRLDLFRHRKARAAADRAAFAALRHHGLKARHRAKLAYLSTRDTPATPKESPPRTNNDTEAA